MAMPRLVRQVSKDASAFESRNVPPSGGIGNGVGTGSVSNNNKSIINNISDSNGINVLMIGTGEYTTGYVNGEMSKSDKGAGVVALTMLDLKSKGITNRLALCGVNGKKFPGILSHMHNAIGKNIYPNSNLDHLIDTIETYPNNDEIDPLAYKKAISKFNSGDVAIIFTPDNTHFDIALECIRNSMHVLITKPIVKTLNEHAILYNEAKKYNVLVSIEVHKRWDPIYMDARDRIQNLGDFSFLNSYMSQPKTQLDTFKAWAGNGSSDISYYLNSHHIDFHEWCVGQKSRPIKVTGTSSSGFAIKHGIDCEDTITLTVEWENLPSSSNGNGNGSAPSSSSVSNSRGTAIYTSSWIAPKSDVHSQQRFFYMGHEGEVNVDQAHRGYHMSDDANGYRSVNPLFMKYIPTDGKFSGQNGYGYRSFSNFIDAIINIKNPNPNPITGIKAEISHYDHTLASISTTFRTTAILDAGRQSLDNKCSMVINYDKIDDLCMPTSIVKA
jgi:D-galacturonate reductase